MSMSRDRSRAPWTSSFETTDPREAHAFLRQVYGESTMRVLGDQDAFRMSHVARGAGPLTSATLVQTSTVEHRTQPTGRLVVGHVRRGHVDVPGESSPAGPGDVLLVGTPNRPRALRSEDVEMHLVQIDQVVVTDLITPAGEGPTIFTRSRPVSAAAGRHCAGLLEFLARDLLANEDAGASPLLVDQAARLLGAALLATFPNTATHPHDPGMSAPATLRRALAFIEDHAHEPVSLAQIAAAAHVTTRALQLTFRQQLATTPTEYLRLVRLDRAHQDLLAAEPVDGVSVTGIARRWGFAHAGRFAARYRQAYGRSPRETLYSAGGRR
jgi:AraC-like DNA-binding protein